MSRSALIAGLPLLLSCAGLGCAAEATPRSHRVAIRGFEYLPGTDTAQVGDTVAWTNEDIVPHTVTVEDGPLNSGPMQSSQAWRFVPAQPGTYAYVCAFHPTMRGTLVVR